MNFYADKPAQEFLNELVDIEATKVFDPHISKEQRVNLIALHRKRLKEWYSGLQSQMKTIEQRYRNDDNGAERTRIALGSYKLLEELYKRLNSAIDAVEQSIKAGRTVPRPITFGTQIFGHPEWEEWHLGERADAVRFDDLVAVKKRLDLLMSERQPLVRELELAMARIKETTNDLKAMMNEYNRRKRGGYIGLRLGVLLLFALIFLGLGAYIFNSEADLVGELADQVLGGALLVLGVAVTIMTFVFMRRWRQGQRDLQQAIRDGRILLKELQADAKAKRLEYYPLNDLTKELAEEYKSLRATF